MEQLSYGSAQFKVKFRETELKVAPGATTSALGILKKGAVVTVIDTDEDAYYYKVRLDNGLEGYVYKPAGTISQGLTPTRITPERTELNTNGTAPATAMPEMTIAPTMPDTGSNGNGRVMPANRNGQNGRTMPDRYTRPASPTRNGTSSSGSRSSGLDVSSNGGGRRAGGGMVIITSAEIAVFDKPGIVGRQVAKLKRGNQVPLVGQDSFFFQVEVPNGATGFIPRYAAELM